MKLRVLFRRAPDIPFNLKTLSRQVLKTCTFVDPYEYFQANNDKALRKNADSS